MIDGIKVIFFDHDDTLVGTIGPKWAQHKYIAKTWYSKELTDEELSRHWGKPHSQLINLLYGQEDPDEAMRHNLFCEDDFPKMFFPNTIPTLRQLHDAGKTLGIITAATRFSLDHDLEMQGFPKDIIEYTQAEEDSSFHKPDSRVFDPAINWLSNRGFKPNEVLYVADGLHDMKAALGANFNFIGVTTGLVTADEFSAAGAISLKGINHLLS